MFSEKFYFGASMAGFQVEMGNPEFIDKNADWYQWSNAKEIINKGLVSGDDPSGGPDYFSNYKNFHKLAAECGMNMLRIGVEWSRIFPEETFDIDDINTLREKMNKKNLLKYKDILKNIKKNGMSTMVCLSHFTIPIWLSDPLKMHIEKDYSKSGWYDDRSIKEFNKFAQVVGEELNSLVDYWVTENEPNISVMGLKYETSGFPPCLSDKDMYNQALVNEAEAHKLAYETLKEISNKPVGVVIALECQTGDINIVKKIQKEMVEPLVKLFEPFDFLGINYYSRYFAKKINDEWMRIEGFGQGSVPNSFTAENRPTSDMGWEIYPEGMYNIAKMIYKTFKKPLFITENGIADGIDMYRPYYLIGHLYAAEKLIEDGVDLRGYLHWSLTDNFEWPKGFEKRFGLIHCDYSDKSLTPRPSYFIYNRIIEEKSTECFKKFLNFPYNLWDEKNLIKDY